MQFHEDPLRREQLIRKYLLRRLDVEAAEAFESHYLVCEECFEEMRVTELLVAGLTDSKIDLRRSEDVLVLEFTSPVQLIRQSQELNQLRQGVLEQKDSRVVVDLSRVSRIDSAGLGLLMSCYSHAVRNHGALKILNPSEQVQRLLRLTRIDKIIETYYDERQAVESFHPPAPASGS